MLKAFRRSLLHAREEEGLYFTALLSEQTINEAFGSARHLWQGWVHTPTVTVWASLSVPQP